MPDVKLSILKLSKTDNTWSWVTQHETWGTVKELAQRNIFSSVAMGAKTIEITVRKQDVTLDNAVRWGDKQLFITAINDTDDRHHVVLTTAEIVPVAVTLTRDILDKDDLNRIVVTGTEILSFPAYLTEKYLGYTRSDPQVIIETQYVLICPKVITLKNDETVSVGDKKYIVLVGHELDTNKNEYEVERTDEP